MGRYTAIIEADGVGVSHSSSLFSIFPAGRRRSPVCRGRNANPPGPVKGLKAVRNGSQITLTWTKPSAADLAGIIVGWYAAPNAPSVWSAGNTAYVGTGTSAKFTSTQHVSISIWTYDTTGNVSSPSIIHAS